MKNKSSHHKSTNRFTFTTFGDRVNLIDVRRSALYHLEHANADAPTNNETYFHNTLMRWRVLNLTAEYGKFTKATEDIVTLPQLLYKKEEIIILLLENLKNGTALNLQPFLELLVALSRDLQEEFYEHFPKFLDVLINLLNTKDPEQLEWSLICLAFLFKYLRTYLRRDLSVILKSILPLLSEKTKWYIRNFAAESFAFVARDVKDKKKFLDTVLKHAQSDENLVSGCGHLLFEVVRGVGGQFHSCAASFLDLYIGTLQSENVKLKLLFDMLTQMNGDMLETIHVKYSKTFWDCILNNLDKFLKARDENAATSLKDNVALDYTLKLIGQSLEYKKGIFLNDTSVILTLLSGLCETELNESISTTVSQIGILLLLCNNITMSHEHSVHITKKLLSIPYSGIVTKFVQEVVPCFSFDIIIFPHFIETIREFNEEYLFALSNICNKKSSLCRSGANLYSWVKYPIDLGSKIINFYSFIEKYTDQNHDYIFNNMDTYLSILITLPHVKHSDFTFLKKVYNTLLTNILTTIKMKDRNETEELCNALFFMAVAVESAIHIINFECLDEVCHIEEIIDVLLPFLSEERFICSLRIIDLILTVRESEHAITHEMFTKIYPLIENNLLSPIHEVRLLTSHICTLFEIILIDFNNTEEASKGGKATQKHKESFQTFSLCYSAENLPLSVENFREQLLKLSKVSHESGQFKISSDKFYKYFSLRFMFGFLHVNFKSFWEPLENFISSFARGIPTNEFWDIYYSCFVKTTQKIRQKHNETSVNYYGLNNLYQDLFNEYNNRECNADYGLYRVHLLNILSQAPNVCEVKNKDFTTEFLDFMNVEFEHTNVATDISENEMDTVKGENDQNDPPADEEKEKHVVNKLTYDSLIAFLKVYGNIQNPKSFFKEQVLRNIYYDLLMHKNPVVQRASLDCLMKYKNKHWIAYKDNMYNLIDGKKFKEELRTFKTDIDSDVIKIEDREELMPVLLRIAFSKMITNMGVDKKGGSQMRRSLVMRFIAGCQENELLIFTDMAFKFYIDFTKHDFDSMRQNVLLSLDTFQSFPPKKLMNSINLLEIMREQLIKPGEVLLLPKLLKIIFCIGTFIGKIISTDTIKTGYKSMLKNVQNMCIQSLANFFRQFSEWPWTETEILYAFNCFVWTTIEKLPSEGIHNPTSLLKLLSVWSTFPRYHNLFNIVNKENGHTAMHYILKLLTNKKSNHSVIDMCMQMIENLLTLERDTEEVIQLSDCNIVSIDRCEIKQKLDLKDLNDGSLVLVPYLPNLVTILRDRFENINPMKLHRRDLLIISRVTELCSDPESVDVLIQFSLPILIQRIGVISTEENFDACIDALTKLLKKSSDPKKHIKIIIPLFSKINTPRARKQLCESINILSTQSDDVDSDRLKTAMEIISEMNATDEKWIDQPDYERRLSVYKRIDEMVINNTIDIDLASLIIHNSFYTFTHLNDISLKLSASDCLKRILPKVLLRFSEIDSCLTDTVISLIKISLKSDNESLRNETITLLGTLVRECPTVSHTLSELLPLASKSDKEIDFFENLQHLQVHRRTRALLRFCTYAKTSAVVPTPKTLTTIIMPLATQYICSDKFVDKTSLVEAAIDTVGVICRLLPWYQYEATLKYYLEKLHRSVDHQKQLIKLISIILDSFHFDLSKVQDIRAVINDSVSGEHPDIDKKTNGNKISKNVENEIGDDQPMEDTICNEGDSSKVVIPYEKVTVLSPSAAKRVILVVTNEILVRLNWSVSQFSDHEELHKSLKKINSGAREEDEKLRLPLGFAIVKLLQKLPQPMLSNNLQSIIIKICTFLKSPLINIRALAREIICKIMVTVGTDYFDVLLGYLTTLLTKGFQVHVLISTVHAVLLSVQKQFTPQQMDKYLDNIMKVCLNDLFGHASEEREVVKLGSKAPEVKPSKKCYLTLRIIAQNISDASILRLMFPFKSIIETTHSKRVVIKIESCFQYISLGLVDNTNISIESSLQFLCGLLSDNIPKFSTASKNYTPTVTLEGSKPKREDCFLIPPDPKGSKKMPKTRTARSSQQANAHVITEFGLNLLHVVLQRDNLTTIDCRPYLDPLVPFIIQAIKNPQVRVSTVGLKCIASLFVKRITLPTLKNTAEDAVKAIFSILHKYSTSGLSKKDENFHLVSNAFKAITILIRNQQYYTFDTEQIRTLLMYAEHDINDHEKQATTFSMLKAILSAKYNLPEVNVIIKKISEMTITNDSAKVREESSQIMLLYLMNYAPPKKLKTYIQFFTSQLEYELDHGRVSAIKILHSMIEKFNLDIITPNSSFLLISLGIRLANETSEECRNYICKSLELMLSRVALIKRNELFDLTMTLLSDDKPVHAEIGANLISRFIVVEKEQFKNRLKVILPKLIEKLYGEDVNAGRFVKLARNIETKENTNSQQSDSCYINILKLSLSVCDNHPNIFFDAEYESSIDELALNCQRLLAYPHVSVRVYSCKFLLKFIQSLKAESYYDVLTTGGDAESRFLHSVESLKSIILDLVSQLIPGEVTEELASAVYENVLYLTKLICDFPKDGKTLSEETENNIDEQWIVKKVRSAINGEVVKCPMTITIRTAAFNMFEKLIEMLSNEKLINVASILMPCFVREISKADSKFESLKNQATVLSSALSDKLGNATYNKILANVQAKIMRKRKERKIKIAQDKVNNPERAAKRKSTLREKKKEYKKRRVDRTKGRPIKRKFDQVSI